MALKIDVIITRELVKLPPGTQEKIANKQLLYLEQQAAAHIDGDGQPMKSKRGAPLDLKETGDLWRQRTVTETPDGAQVTFANDYARHVFAELGGRFKGLTLSPQYLARCEADIQPFLNEAYLQEDK